MVVTHLATGGTLHPLPHRRRRRAFRQILPLRPRPAALEEIRGVNHRFRRGRRRHHDAWSGCHLPDPRHLGIASFKIVKRRSGWDGQIVPGEGCGNDVESLIATGIKARLGQTVEVRCGAWTTSRGKNPASTATCRAWWWGTDRWPSPDRFPPPRKPASGPATPDSVAGNFGTYRAWFACSWAETRIPIRRVGFIRPDLAATRRLVFVFLGNINHSAFAQGVASHGLQRPIRLTTSTSAPAFDVTVTTAHPLRHRPHRPSRHRFCRLRIPRRRPALAMPNPPRPSPHHRLGIAAGSDRAARAPRRRTASIHRPPLSGSLAPV